MSDLPPADESVSDDALARAFIAGDASAMEALYRRHRRQMFGWIARTLPDRSEAEDAYQEVWLRVLRGIDGYKPQARQFQGMALERCQKLRDRPFAQTAAGAGAG